MSVDDNEFLIPIEESRRARPASVEQKALGNRLARLVGSRLVDRPSIGEGRRRRGGMDIDAPTGGVRGYRKPTLSNFDPDNDGWVDEGSTNPRFIGIDSPTRGTETARRMSSGANEDYRGQHGAPERGAGAPLHDMLADGGVYPEDVYSADAIRFYGVGDDQLDPIAASLIKQYKGKPNAEVTIYRAVPLSNSKKIEKLEKQLARYMARGKLPEGTSRSIEPSDWSQGVRDEIERLKNLPPDDMKITPGDWVTPIREYAVMHGDGALRGEYQIIKKRVKAKDIYTAGDSWLEWGYDPEVTKKLSSGTEINNADISAAYTQEIFGKLRALKERLGYGTNFEEKVSKEKLDTRIKETAESAKRQIDYYFKKDTILPQEAIDYINEVVAEGKFFTSEMTGRDAEAAFFPIQARLRESGVWAKGDPIPPSVALEISRQIHIARGDTEMVAKIDEFKTYLKTATPEQLNADMRKASEAYGKSIDTRVLVRTRSIASFIKGNRTILTQHDKEEREAADIESMNLIGDAITTSARRKVEGNLLGLPFEEGVEDPPEVRELRPSSGYVTTSKTALAREEKFKKIYGDDIKLMYEGPAGAALEASQNRTQKYGDSHFVLRPEVAERTRVFDADTVDMSMKDNAPLQLSSLGEDGVFLSSFSPLGILYDYKTGDTYPTPSGAFEASSDNGISASYKEALVLGRFKPEEVQAIIATPKEFRKELGELSKDYNENNESNVSLLIDMAQSRDELMREYGIEVVPNIRGGVFKTDDVEMFNPAMTDVWFDKNFGDKGLSKEEIIPDKSTTPYEAWLRVLVKSEKLPVIFEYRGPSGKSEEDKDVWKRDVLKEELARVLSVKTSRAPEVDDSQAFNQLEEQMGDRLSSGKAPRYPREPTLGAFLGEADSYFGDSNSWEEFKKKYNDAEIVFLDYETTGLNFDEFGKATTNGKPTQIGLVRMKNGEEIGRLNLFMNPEEPLGEWSLANLKDADGNPITNEWLATQMPMAEAHRQVAEFIGPDAIIGVQNATFDKNVLDDALRESGIDWTPRGYLDTREISSLTLPVWSEDSPDGPHIVSSRDGTTKPSSSLAAITEYLGVELGDGHHNADADAFATSQVMQKIIDGAIENNWDTSVLSRKRRDEKLRLEREKFDADVKKFESDKESFVAAQKEEGSTRLSSGRESTRFTVARGGNHDDSFDQTLEFANPEQEKFKYWELYEKYKRYNRLEPAEDGFGQIDKEAQIRALNEAFGPDVDTWAKALEILNVRRKRFKEDEAYKEELKLEHIKRYGYLYSPVYKNGEKTKKAVIEVYDDELAYNSLDALIGKIGKGTEGQTKAVNKVKKVLEGLEESNKLKNRAFKLEHNPDGSGLSYVLMDFDAELSRQKSEEMARLREIYKAEGMSLLDAMYRAIDEIKKDERFSDEKIYSNRNEGESTRLSSGANVVEAFNEPTEVTQQEAADIGLTRESLTGKKVAERIIKKIEETTGKELTKQQKYSIEDAIPGLTKEIAGKTLLDVEVDNAFSETGKQLLESISIDISSDGIPFVSADPIPQLAEQIPDKRDWRTVELPKRDDVISILDEAMKDTVVFNGSVWKDSDGNIIARKIYKNDASTLEFENDEARERFPLLEMLAPKGFVIRSDSIGLPALTQDTLPEPYLEAWKKHSKFVRELTRRAGELMGDEELFLPGSRISHSTDTYLRGYIGGITDPHKFNMGLYGKALQDTHDLFGHLGTGRAFDRHGEWANDLAMMSLADHPDSPLTPQEKMVVKHLHYMMYSAERMLRVGRLDESDLNMNETMGYRNRPRTVFDIEGVSDSETRIYAGDFNSVIKKLDTASTSGRLSSGSKPIYEANEEDIELALAHDILGKSSRPSLASGQERPSIQIRPDSPQRPIIEIGRNERELLREHRAKDYKYGDKSVLGGEIRKTTNTWLRGLSSEQMAKVLVPSNREEHFQMWLDDYAGADVVDPATRLKFQKYYDDFHQKNPWDTPDFSPDNVKAMQELLAQSIEDNPQMKWAFENHGAPSFSFMDPEGIAAYEAIPEVREKFAAIAKQRNDGKPVRARGRMSPNMDTVYLNKEVFLEALDDSIPSVTKSTLRWNGQSPVKGQKSIENSLAGTLLHEWGHWLHFKAIADSEGGPKTTIHTRQRYGSKDKGNTNYARALAVASEFNKFTYDQDRITMFENDVPFSETPDVPRLLTSYGNVNMAETMAEGIVAVLHPDEKIQNEMISPSLKKAVTTLLGGNDTYQPWRDGDRAGRILSSGRSPGVRDERRGRLESALSEIEGLRRSRITETSIPQSRDTQWKKAQIAKFVPIPTTRKPYSPTKPADEKDVLQMFIDDAVSIPGTYDIDSSLAAPKIKREISKKIAESMDFTPQDFVKMFQTSMPGSGVGFADDENFRDVSLILNRTLEGVRDGSKFFYNPKKGSVASGIDFSVEQRVLKIWNESFIPKLESLTAGELFDKSSMWDMYEKTMDDYSIGSIGPTEMRRWSGDHITAIKTQLYYFDMWGNRETRQRREGNPENDYLGIYRLKDGTLISIDSYSLMNSPDDWEQILQKGYGIKKGTDYKDLSELMVAKIDKNTPDDAKDLEVLKELTIQNIKKVIPSPEELLKSRGLVEFDANTPEGQGVLKQALISGLVHTWAISANDSNDVALSMQNVARELFSVDGAVGWDRGNQYRMDRVVASPGPGQIMEDFDGAPVLSEMQRKFVGEFLQTSHEATQQYFEDRGITHLAVYRGITAGENAFGEPIAIGDMDIREVRMRPLSSWSINEATARSFSRRPGNDQSGYVIKAFVPIKDIFSTPFTGFGCLEEDETVILGRPMQAMVFRVDEATRYSADGESLATKLVDVDRDSMAKQIEAKKLSSGETDVLEKPTPYKADTRFNTSYEKEKLDEQSSYMRRFTQALEHYNKTGDWLGGDFDVVVASDKNMNAPTIHSSEAQAKNLLKADIVTRAEDAFTARHESWTRYPGSDKEPERDSFVKNWIKKFEDDINEKSRLLKEEVALLQYKHDSKKIRIEQNVLDLEDITPEEYDDLLKETREILELKQNDRDKYWELFGNGASDGEKFLIHQGSSELDGGVLNPKKTVGSDGFNVASADTKALNNINVADVKARNNQIEKQIEELKKFIESASTDGTIHAGNYNRNSLGLLSSNLSQEFRQNSPDQVIDLAARGWDVAHFISEAHKRIAGLENEQVDVKSVIKALEEADNQFLSALMTGEELAGGYFGRYAHRIIPKHIAENLSRDWDFENRGKDLKVHDSVMMQRWQYAMRGTQWIIGGEQHKHWTNKLGPGYEKQIIGMQRPFVGFSSVTLDEGRNRLYAITPALIVRAIKNYKQGNKKVDLSTLVKPRSISGTEVLQPDELNQELRMSSGKKKVVESVMNANYYGIVSARHIEHTSKDGNETSYWVVLDAGGTITAYDTGSVNDARQKLSESWTKLGFNPMTDKKGPVPIEEVNVLDALKRMEDSKNSIGLMTTIKWNEDDHSEILRTGVARTRRRTGIASEMMRLHRDTWPEQNLQHSDALSPDGRAFAASATPEVLDGQRESVGKNAGKKLSSGLTEHVSNEHAKALVAAYPRSLKEPTEDIAIARKEGRPVSWLLDETIDPKIGAVIGELIDGVLDDPRFKKAFDGEEINPFLLETSKGPWARIRERSPFSERIGPAIDKITGIVLSRDPQMMEWDAETIAKGLVLRAGIHITRAKYLENERKKIIMSADMRVRGTVEDLVSEYDKYAKELVGMGGDYFQPGPMDYNRVVVAVDKEAISGLIKNKKLLSQFETGRSNGHYNPQARQQAEVTLFGYPPDMAPEFRPIYGMAAYGGVTEEVAGSGQQYGNYLLVLKPGNEDRTTVTESDSLSLMGTTSAMNSPDINMMMLRNAGEKDTFDYPVEAQVHPGEGGISLDDIAYIIVRDDYTGENPDEGEKLQALSRRLGIPAVSEYDIDYGGTPGAFDEDYILNAGGEQAGDSSPESTRLSSGRSNRRLRKGRPGAKPRSDAEYVAYSANELSIRAVPSSPEELASILRSSPHTKNSNKSIRKINKLIEELEINWDKQKELQKKVELTLSNSPSLRNMLGRFDIPPMLLTDFGLKQGFIFESDLEPTNWYAGGGVYTPSYGFIAFPDKVLKDYIPGTNLTGEYVIRHELGHAIHAMAKKTNKAAFKRESEDLDGIYKELKAATSWAKDELKAGRSSSEIEDELSSMVNMLSEYDSSLAKQISDYAATNRAEYIAEAIAYATAPANEGLRRLKAEHYDMLSEFLGLTVEELKTMGL